MPKKVKAIEVDEELWKHFRIYCVKRNSTLTIELDKILRTVLSNKKSVHKNFRPLLLQIKTLIEEALSDAEV